MLKNLLTSCLLFTASYSLAQDKNIQFYPVSKGLSQHTITSIIQDKKGFIWIGTRHGLNRYDGLDYKTYEHVDGDTAVLSNSTIQCLQEDKNGNIWIGTYGGGLNYYNYKKEKFSTFRYDRNNPNSLSDDFVTAIFEDFEGNIWVGTENGGLNLLDKNSGNFVRYLSNEADNSSITNNNVTSIDQDDNGHLWIGTYGGGLNLFNQNKQEFIAFNTENTPALQTNVVRSLFKTRTGQLLVGTDMGLHLLTYKNGRYLFKKPILENTQLSSQLNKNRVLSICEDLKSRIWVGTENEGLYMIDLTTGASKHFLYTPENEYGVNSNSIWSLLTSRNGTTWIGTYNQGLFKVDPYAKKFDGLYRHTTSSNSLSHNVVSSFAEDRNGNLWISTDGGGLNYFDRKTKKFEHYKNSPGNPGSLASDAVVSIMVDSKNNLWAGTWEGGIGIKSPGHDFFKRMVHDPNNKNSPSGNDIYKIYEDDKGNIWIGAFRNGLDVYDPISESFHHFPDKTESPRGICDKKIRAIYQDHFGYMWVGTEGAGLNKLEVDHKFNIKDITHYTKNGLHGPSLSNNTITYIYEDSDTTLWIGTEGGGLNWYDRDKDEFFQISNNQKLQNNIIYGIIEDRQKRLWISTNNGLACFDKTNGDVKVYNESDGLQSSEFYKSSCFKTHDGYLLFGGLKGFNMFKPDNVTKNPYPPDIYIMKFFLSNEEVKPTKNGLLKNNILETDQIDLKHNQNDFSFEFAALNFSQPDKNEYAYKLENYDDKWQRAGNRNDAYYTNVPPGNYTFKVRGSNNDGLWSEQLATIDVNISKPWYSTYLAFSIYTLIILGILFWSRQNIIYKERLQAQLQVEHVELTKMQELDQLKSRFFANISHEFRTPLTLIISPLKSLYLDETKNEHKKQIRMMIRNAERLLRLINQILDLSELESGGIKLKASEQDLIRFVKPLAYSFATYADKQFIVYKTFLPKEPVYMYFERDKMEKIFTNLLSNAIKYTPEFGEVKFSVEQKPDHIEIRISDTGIGIADEQLPYIFDRFHRAHTGDEAKGTGIGLALTKELVELHKGKVDVFSKEGKGTTFRLTFPIGNKHLHESEISDEPVISMENRKRYYEDSIYDDVETSQEADSEVEQSVSDLPLILIAEDNLDMRSFISSYLETDYHILESDNGKTAFELAQEQIPDIIISDIMMPVMDGYQLCDALKNDEKTSHIPIIFLTAKASNESIEQGLELGANYFVTKPFNPKLLALHIKNILKSRQLFKEQVLNNKTINLEPKHVVISSADENFVKKTIKCVEDNIGDSSLQVEDLCKHLGMSKIQLYRKLKGLIGQSANEFIRTIRLKRAAQLLKQQNLTIAEITYKVGFNDLQYFRHCFKKQYGVNPSEFVQGGEV